MAEKTITPKNICLIGAPVDSGKRQKGCRMGPDALHVAGLAKALEDLEHNVRDIGSIIPSEILSSPIHVPVPDPMLDDAMLDDPMFDEPIIHEPEQTVNWIEALQKVGEDLGDEELPIFLGGDHSLSMGSVSAMALRAAKMDRKLFLLWIDAHSDFNTPMTSESGHTHGMSVAWLTGQSGFEVEEFPSPPCPISGERVALVGLRSVDRIERIGLKSSGIELINIRSVSEGGVRAPLLLDYLNWVREEEGLLHVSFDADSLDPSLAPGTGTPVSGGLGLREAYLIMEMIHESGLLSSLDLAELNPFLDNRGQTAKLLVDLTAVIFGEQVFAGTRD